MNEYNQIINYRMNYKSIKNEYLKNSLKKCSKGVWETLHLNLDDTIMTMMYIFYQFSIESASQNHLYIFPQQYVLYPIILNLFLF